MSTEKPVNSLRRPLTVARKNDFTFATRRPRAIMSVHSANNAAGFLSLPVELQLEVFGYCNVHVLFQLGAASRRITKLAVEYMTLRMELTIQRFFSDVQGFQQMLRSCDAVMSGSSALHILLPAKTTSWVPINLDIYVLSLHYHHLSVLLDIYGYQKIHKGKENVSRCSSSLIHNVVTFANGDQQIDVIVLKIAGGISPILQFHSMAVMNFFRADHLFCAYPALTLNHLAKVNPGPLYFDRFWCCTLNALLKYAERGFRFMSCETSHFNKYTCKSVVWSLTDGGCLWIDLNTFPRISTTPLDLFQHYGFLDVHWVLGGMVCGSQSMFMDARIHVVQDQSCVAPHSSQFHMN